MYQLIVATAHDVTALTLVEIIRQEKTPRTPVRVVQLHERYNPKTTDFSAVVDRIVALTQRTRGVNGGAEPKLLVHLGGNGAALFESLKEARKVYREIKEYPSPIATAPFGTEQPNVNKTAMAGKLKHEWEAGRIRFAEGLPALADLRSQLGQFTPKELPGGSLRFGDDEATEFDLGVVTLIISVAKDGRGRARVMDGWGEVSAPWDRKGGWDAHGAPAQRD